ncbi:MAG: GNAT family N-acetyltransferase [Acidimicrobiales bacterium]
MRLGVVLLVPPPLDREINTLRRAVGDGTYGRVPAHLTLVPPVNVNEENLAAALAVLREAAADTEPFRVGLGAPTTFLPANPVLYLPPTGDGRAAVFDLRQRVFREPFDRALTWPFVPHVTIADEVDPERIKAAELALCDYTAQVGFDRLHLLQEGPGRVWGAVADFPFERPAVVGRGGLPLELTVSQRLDPESRAFADLEWSAHQWTDGFGDRDPDAPNLAVVGRRDGQVVGVAEGWARAGAAYLGNIIVGRDVRRQGVGSHVLAAFEAAALERGATRLGADVWSDSAAEAFYKAHGWVEESRRPRWWNERDLVLLRRDRQH